MDRIIPADDYPSASENEVLLFLQNLLAGDLADMRHYYVVGLTAIDAEARALFGVSFAELDAERQDAILTCIEADETLTPWIIGPQEFFNRVVQHVSEGYYADPGNGANLDKASWRMIGFADRSGISEAHS